MRLKISLGRRERGGCDVALAVTACITHLKHTNSSIITIDTGGCL
jgi:hypothetical protein